MCVCVLLGKKSFELSQAFVLFPPFLRRWTAAHLVSVRIASPLRLISPSIRFLKFSVWFLVFLNRFVGYSQTMRPSPGHLSLPLPSSPFYSRSGAVLRILGFPIRFSSSPSTNFSHFFLAFWCIGFFYDVDICWLDLWLLSLIGEGGCIKFMALLV